MAPVWPARQATDVEKEMLGELSSCEVPRSQGQKCHGKGRGAQTAAATPETPASSQVLHSKAGAGVRALTSRFCTSSFTLAAVSVDCLPDEASFINVDKKFLHFFTFSIVSWIEIKKV